MGKAVPTLVEGFVVLSLDSLQVFLYNPERNQYALSTLLMEQASHHCQALPLCAMSALADHKNNFFK